jgi:hypothetical protein
MTAIPTMKGNTPEGMVTFGRSTTFFTVWLNTVRFSRAGTGVGSIVTVVEGFAAMIPASVPWTHGSTEPPAVPSLLAETNAAAGAVERARSRIRKTMVIR